MDLNFGTTSKPLDRPYKTYTFDLCGRTLSVDIGRVKVQVALFDESYNIVDHQSFDSCIDDPNKTLDEIASRVLKFTKTICGIGISCPGILDAMKGTLLYTPNLGDKWCGLHVTEALSKRTGLPVYLENNAKLLSSITPAEGITPSNSF